MVPPRGEEVLRPRWLGPEKKKEVQKKARKIDTAFQEAIRVYHAVRREAVNKSAEGEEGPVGAKAHLLGDWRS